MFLRGLLFGIALALISLYVCFRGYSLPFSSSPDSSLTSFDLRGLIPQAISFFGGMGIGFASVLILVFGSIYGVWLYMLRHVPLPQR
jgi:hypothetical protein